MRQSCMWKQALLLATLILTALGTQVRFHLNHPLHSGSVRRHDLTARQHRVRHDMRAFTSHGSHLSHLTAEENHELNDMGYFFTLNLTIGGLPYSLNIDTGSSDIFIKGEDSPGNPAKKYTCPSCRQNSQKIIIGYLDGNLDTYKTNLVVQLKQHTFNESVLVAYTAPHNFEEAEGLLGLSFPQLARNKDPTFVQTLINNNIIGEYAFGVNLNFQQHHHSFISFGTPDADLFEGELKKYPINLGYSYSIRISGISVSEGPLLSMSTALLDTGNTCISIPSKFDQQVLKQFNTNGNSCGFDNEDYAPMFSLLRCKVKDHEKLPSFKIHIGEDVYEIDHNVYMQRCYQKEGEDHCDTYIESVKSQSQLFLGDGFFNRYYTFFDIGKREVGFAKNKQILSYKYMYIDESEMDSEDRQFFDKL